MNDCSTSTISLPGHQGAIGCARDTRTAPVLVEARALCIAFDDQPVLRGVDVELRRGEVVLLRGENGTGKTTLLNILTGNLQPNSGTIRYFTGAAPREYRFPRRWWQGLNLFDGFAPEYVSREGVGRTWQETRLFGSLSVDANIAVAQPGNPGENPLGALLGWKRSANGGPEIDAVAEDLLSHSSLAERRHVSADFISLGESKRVAALRALAAGAEVLFLDEPLAGLDRGGISDVLAMLEALVSDQSMALVIVEHVNNQPHLRSLVTTDWLLENGKLIRSDAHPAGCDVPAPVMTPPRPTWLDGLIGPDSEVVDERLPRGALLTRIRPRACAAAAAGDTLFEATALCVVRGRRTVIGLDGHGELVGFDLRLEPGEVAVLQAPNGWGKTTLAEALAGTLKESSGDICLAGRSLTGIPAWGRRRAGICVIPAGHSGLTSFTVADQMALAGIPPDLPLLAPLVGRRVGALSGGQRQMLSLASMLSDPRPMLRVLDEPFAQLDAANAREIMPLLRPRPDEATLILVPTQAPNPNEVRSHE